MGKDFREQEAKKPYTFPGPGLEAYGAPLSLAQKGTLDLHIKKIFKGAGRRTGRPLVFCPKCRLSSNVRSVKWGTRCFFECWRCDLKWHISFKDLKKFKKPATRSERPLVVNPPSR